MYKFVAQNKVRFPSNRGLLTVENLFELPLKARDGFDLDTVARTIHTELKDLGEVSFVDVVSPNPRKKQLEVALEVVLDVIKTKQDENAATRQRLEKAEKRKKILDVIAAKKDEKLSAASLEELEKELAALEV